MKIRIFEKNASFGHTSWGKWYENGTIVAECNSIPHERIENPVGNRNGQIPLAVVRNAFRNNNSARRDLQLLNPFAINEGDRVKVKWHYTVNPRDARVPTHFTFNVIFRGNPFVDF